MNEPRTRLRYCGRRGGGPSGRSLLVLSAVSLLACLSITTSACRPQPLASEVGYSLILINIDTLRADHVGAYGYSRSTTPFLDRLASEGVVFEEARSTSSFTRESVSSLFTGRLPTSGGSVGWGATPHPGAPTLAELFRAAGYQTGFLSNTTSLTAEAFARGFDEVQNLPERWDLSRMGPRLSKRARKFLRKHRRDNFLLYLHYLDPHGPYDPPPSLYRRFADTIFEKPLSLYGTVRTEIDQLVEEGFGPGDDRFEDLVLRYDAEIASTDEAIEQLFSTLEQLDLLERTMVVVTADHGEEFLEHGFVEHAWTLYEESIRVPLLFWAPDLLAPQRVSSKVSGVDVMPSLLKLLVIPHDPLELDGRPLFAPQGDRMVGEPADGRVVAELLIRERNVMRSVIVDGWKYIATYRWLPPGERGEAALQEGELRRENRELPVVLWGPVVRRELYDLRRDPRETTDLASTHPEKLLELEQELEIYRQHCAENGLRVGEGASDPPVLTPEEEERLRALGYL